MLESAMSVMGFPPVVVTIPVGLAGTDDGANLSKLADELVSAPLEQQPLPFFVGNRGSSDSSSSEHVFDDQFFRSVSSMGM